MPLIEKMGKWLGGTIICAPHLDGFEKVEKKNLTKEELAEISKISLIFSAREIVCPKMQKRKDQWAQSWQIL